MKVKTQPEVDTPKNKSFIELFLSESQEDWCANNCAGTNGPRRSLMCKCCASGSHWKPANAPNFPKFLLGTGGRGCSNPLFSADSYPIHEGYFSAVGVKTLWKTLIKTPGFRLTFPNVREKRVLEEAPKKGASASSTRATPEWLDYRESTQVLQGPVQMPRQTQNYNSHHTEWALLFEQQAITPTKHHLLHTTRREMKWLRSRCE